MTDERILLQDELRFLAQGAFARGDDAYGRRLTAVANALFFAQAPVDTARELIREAYA